MKTELESFASLLAKGNSFDLSSDQMSAIRAVLQERDEFESERDAYLSRMTIALAWLADQQRRAELFAQVDRSYAFAEAHGTLKLRFGLRESA